MTHDDFLQAIIAEPDDNALRWAYSDWLEEIGDHDRAEFIRLQCRFADPNLKGPPRWKVRAAIHRLLRKNETIWLGDVPTLASRWEFRRGFIEFVEMDTARFLTEAEALFRCAPIRHVKLVDYPAHLSALASSPLLSRIAALQLEHVDARELQILLASPYLASTRELLLGGCGRFGAHGAELLGQCPYLSNLSRLDVSGNVIGDAGVQALLVSSSLTSLTELDLASNRLSARAIRALAGDARAKGYTALILRENDLGDEGAEALANSPYLGQLRELHLQSTRISDCGAAALAASQGLSRITWLDFLGNPISQEQRRALIARFGKGTCKFQ